jgi:hypothetical protein
MTDFDLDSIMEEDGYIPETPIEGLTENHDSDAKLCADGTCQLCGYKGLELRTFIDWSVVVYRAFAECPRCGNVEQL